MGKERVKFFYFQPQTKTQIIKKKVVNKGIVLKKGKVCLFGQLSNVAFRLLPLAAI